MSIDAKQTILDLVEHHPLAVRAAFSDDAVLRALRDIGVGGQLDIVVAALHAPSPTARTKTGRGVTLCGEDRSVRHELVTCKHCLRMLKKAQ